MGNITVFVLVVLVGSLIAAAPFITSKRPDAKEIFDKLIPAQGAIGIAMLIWGIINLLDMLDTVGFVLEWIPVTGIALILEVLVAIVLGFVLGYGLIVKYVLSKNEAALEKADKMKATLAKLQVPLGIVGIIASLFLLLISLEIITPM